MLIYKVGNTKKDGLQKYHVSINYVADNGQKRQITRSVYGIDVAKNLEKQLENEIKVQQEIPIKKMTVKQLFDEYISIKKYEVREITLEKSSRIIKRYILPILKDVRIDKLSTKVLHTRLENIYGKKKFSINNKKECIYRTANNVKLCS